MKDEQIAEQKEKLAFELETALKDEYMSKKFSEMAPKILYEYKGKKEKVKGVQLTKTKLNTCEGPITIVVKDPTLKDEGFFGGKHTLFTIETSPLNWKVQRKDKDFNFLRAYLVKAFPHILVPAVPEYQSAKVIEQNFMRKRESLLNRFMNKLLQQEELKACQMLIDWLTIAGNKFFRNLD